MTVKEFSELKVDDEIVTCFDAGAWNKNTVLTITQVTGNSRYRVRIGDRHYVGDITCANFYRLLEVTDRVCL